MPHARHANQCRSFFSTSPLLQLPNISSRPQPPRRASFNKQLASSPSTKSLLSLCKKYFGKDELWDKENLKAAVFRLGELSLGGGGKMLLLSTEIDPNLDNSKILQDKTFQQLLQKLQNLYPPISGDDSVSLIWSFAVLRLNQEICPGLDVNSLTKSLFKHDSLQENHLQPNHLPSLAYSFSLLKWSKFSFSFGVDFSKRCSLLAKLGSIALTEVDKLNANELATFCFAYARLGHAGGVWSRYDCSITNGSNLELWSACEARMLQLLKEDEVDFKQASLFSFCLGRFAQMGVFCSQDCKFSIV
tara:strand:- start:21 stop:929 length:909 start_codon:yes stop_codon:yes gene_type:complete